MDLPLNVYQVRLFAAFREAAGIASLELESTARTPAELFAELGERYPALPQESAALVAINEEMARWDSALGHGDEVLFFPPVAGG